ncbi:hypothetical protein MF271_20565 (plasmid) [Deinococcus sp. KNUC1210]|uniref:hypothetical protein n=1 Tax=Deinococcus sp. KNUC1210 TaxID=2917691 RepID=UPI001EF0734B|nr:hypothetical protein [Deinococcus sp. KNUC1210]ULH17792.1 hypothetical protein MF271_20565 [Deinococcus sp. KNUC1210]
MTQKEKEAGQVPTPAQPETAQPDATPTQPAQPTSEEHGAAGQPGTVSDDQVSDDGTGTHGRPTDDSDPGHS